MRNIPIEPKNHTNKDNDNFVGMRFSYAKKDSQIEAIFPLGYDFLANIQNKIDFQDSDNQKQLKKELYYLLKIIRQYSNSKFDSLLGQSYTEESFPFDAYITIIEMFMQYGYYIENEITYQKTSLGKINWKRTISQVKPMFQDDSIIYLDFITRKNKKRIDNLITYIHEWCVFEAFSKFGFLFTEIKTKKPSLEINEDNKNIFETVLQNELAQTFNDKNKLLFSSMLAMLRLNKSKGNQPFFFGTTNFHHVWENVIDGCFGVQKEEKKKYYPPAQWILNNKLKDKENNLIPDTVMRSSNNNRKELFLLDSKYYAFENFQYLPGASDINKQIAYGDYAYKLEMEDENENIPIFNAFLIPYNFRKDTINFGTKNKIDNLSQTNIDESHFFFIGYAELKDETKKNHLKHERVLGILVDTKWLLKQAVNANKKSNIESLSEFIKKSYKEEVDNG
ncbi:MAG: LlaJI family restriction endonuclease [Clostridia bacterium]|jgi:hypothetical protein|nr:LlaJI family restriction endonuclease [Clostridia bacterium]